MKPVLYIKSSDENDVRLRKFLKFFNDNSFDACFWGWNRNKSQLSSTNSNYKYLLSGGGFSNNKLVLFYPLWMLIVFFRVIFSNDVKKYNIIVVNFESALPLFIASYFRKIEYIYEIYDEFAMSYNFHSFFKRVITVIDLAIKKRSKFVIHVDDNRVQNNATYKYVVIQNTPNDYFYSIHENENDVMKHEFAVIGYLTENRGIYEIIKFAKEHEHITFYVIGACYNKKLEETILSVPNMIYSKIIPQEQLFGIIKNVCGIFSLYDTSIEINRLAASNKVYDSMMLGIPVITNSDVSNSKFIIENKIGFCLNYSYDDSWQLLSETAFVKIAKTYGINGRELYLKSYQFESLIREKLLPQLN